MATPTAASGDQSPRDGISERTGEVWKEPESLKGSERVFGVRTQRGDVTWQLTGCQTPDLCLQGCLCPTEPQFGPLPFRCPVPALSFPRGLTAAGIAGRIRAKMVPELGLEKGKAFPHSRARASPLVCSETASQSQPLPSPGGCPEGSAFPSWTRTPDQRREDSAMAGLPGPVLCGALLGLVCLTGEEGAGAAVGGCSRARRGRPGPVGPGKGVRARRRVGPLRKGWTSAGPFFSSLRQTHPHT